MQIEISCYYVGRLFFGKLDIGWDIWNMFASDTQCLSCVMLPWVWSMYAWMLIVCVVVFPVVESNDDCAEEGEVFEYQEEGDQGQANQDKQSTCCISESY
jgi:hypothetical protein